MGYWKKYNNKIINNDTTGSFLRVQAGKWGTSGANGGNVTLNTSNQVIEGDVYIDNISTLAMTMESGSQYTGTINGANTAKTLSVSLDNSSTLTLTGDSYISSLTNAVSDNSNINLNGHKLYVNGTEITSTNYSGNNSSSNATVNESLTETKNSNDNNNLGLIIATVVIAVVVCAGIAYYCKSKNK